MKAASALLLLSALALVFGKKKEEPLNRETTPFWLQDQTDGKSYSCLIRCRSELLRLAAQGITSDSSMLDAASCKPVNDQVHY